jgi:hypothetical protein
MTRVPTTVLLFLFALLSASAAEAGSIPTLSGNQNPDLQYYSIFSINTTAAPHNTKNNLKTLLQFSNLVWIDETVPGGVPAQLALVKAAGKKAILSFNYFAWKGSAPNVTLRSNWLSTFKNVYAPLYAGYADTVVAFYPYDEPFPSISAGGQLATFIAGVKSVFPNWKAAVFFSADSVNGHQINNTQVGGNAQPNTIPTGYDWVGVDCYAWFNSCQGQITPPAPMSIPDYNATLKAMSSNPRLEFIVAPIGFYDATQASANEQNVIDDDNKYFAYAMQSGSHVVGIFPFNYESFAGGTSGLEAGIQDMPDVLANIESFGNQMDRMTAYYPLANAYSNNVLPGWPASNVIDGSSGSSYSSTFFPDSGNSNGTLLIAWMNTTSTSFTVQNVSLTARTINGVPWGFPAMYDISVTTPDNTNWVYQGRYTTQPNDSGVATIQLPSAVSTYGVMITPVVLGVDPYGNHYFQMAEIGVQGPLNESYSLPMMNASSDNELSGWPASSVIGTSKATDYSSNYFPSAANSSGIYLGAWLDTSAGPATVEDIVLTARMQNGVALGFPQSYHIAVTSPDDSTWLSAGTYTAQPDPSSGMVVIHLSQAVQTYGVLIIPESFGTDNYGNHFFQMSKVGFTGYY